MAPEFARGEHVELQLQLAPLLEHRGAAVDLPARLVVLDQRLTSRAEVDAVDLAVDAALGELQRALLGILEAEGRLGVGRHERRCGGSLIGEEGQDQPFDPPQRSRSVGDLRRQALRANL